MSFPTLYLKTARATNNQFIVDGSNTLIVTKTAVDATDAVNKSVLDTAVGALTVVINTITDSSFALQGAFDTLPEIMTAVNKEISDRAIAVSAEAAARLASDVALQAQISDTSIVPFSLAVFGGATGTKPAPLPSALVGAGHQGWYYKKKSSGAGKINWYVVNNNPSALGSEVKFTETVGQIKELNIPVTLLNKASRPFINIYTKPKGNYDPLNPDAYKTDTSKDVKSWYHAVKVWSVDGDGRVGNVNDGATLVNGGQYLFRVNVNATALTASYPSYTNVDLLPTVVVTSSLGNFALDDEILYIAISSDSGALINEVEFVVKHFEMRTNLGNKKMLFSNDSVMTNYLLEKLQVMYTDLYQSDISTIL